MNLKSQYEACSFDKLKINKAADRTASVNGKADIVNGKYKLLKILLLLLYPLTTLSIYLLQPHTTQIGATTVQVTTSTSETDSVMRPAITEELKAQFGVTNPNQLADHVMYCLPANTMSGIAYAYINSWNSVYSNEWCTYVSGQLHEIGHNLAL